MLVKVSVNERNWWCLPSTPQLFPSQFCFGFSFESFSTSHFLVLDLSARTVTFKICDTSAWLSAPPRAQPCAISLESQKCQKRSFVRSFVFSNSCQVGGGYRANISNTSCMQHAIHISSYAYSHLVAI